MSLRMVMSLTSNLAEEPADDEGQLTLDLTAESRPLLPQPGRPKAWAESDVADALRASDRIDAALDEMRDFLSVTHPTTDAEALQSLRIAFPGVPLTDRITAIKTRFFRLTAAIDYYSDIPAGVVSPEAAENLARRM